MQSLGVMEGTGLLGVASDVRGEPVHNSDSELGSYRGGIGAGTWGFFETFFARLDKVDEAVDGVGVGLGEIGLGIADGGGFRTTADVRWVFLGTGESQEV